MIHGHALRQHLNEMIECGEPSTEGSWYTVRLADLIERGNEYIEIHWADDAENPNGVRLLDKEGE